MFLIACPYCGPRSQAEFAFERTVEAIAHPDATPDATIEALYTRTNARDFAWELWRHAYGCRAWLKLRRHVVTHEIAEIHLAGAGA